MIPGWVVTLAEGLTTLLVAGRELWQQRGEPPKRIDEIKPGAATAQAVEVERARARERWPDEPSLRPSTTILPPTPAIEVAVPTTRPPGEPDEDATDDDFGNALPTSDDTGDFPVAEDLDDDLPY